MLGSSNSRNGGEVSLIAQSLVENDTYEKVIVLAFGVGASPVAAGEGSELTKIFKII